MTSARELASLYDRALSALQRANGDGVSAFMRWLIGFWDEGPAEPVAPPAAVSLSTPAGDSVRWYDADGLILGYVNGGPPGCYRVPSEAEPPAIATQTVSARTSYRRAASGQAVRAAPWRQYGPRR